MFGIGPVELLLVIIVGLIGLSVPVAILLGVFWLASNHKVADENQRLREEVDRLKRGQA